MKKLTILGIIPCIGLLFGPAAVFGAGPKDGLNVNVVSPDPLPVTGEVTATFTEDVDVNVTNTTPIPVTHAGEPLHASLCTGEGPDPNFVCHDVYTVPDEMRLVIEFVSAVCRTQLTSAVSVLSIATTIQGLGQVNHPFGVTPISPPDPGNNRYTMSQVTRLYADAGTDVSANMSSFKAVENQECNVSLSGRLIDD
jgi:hypothetical protein